MADAEKIQMRAGKRAPNNEALTVCASLPYGKKNNSVDLKNVMPGSTNDDVLGFTADYVRGCILVPGDTEIDQIPEVAEEQLPAKVTMTSRSKELSPGQKKVNKKIGDARYQVMTALRVVSKVIGQFGSVEQFCDWISPNNASDVVETAAKEMGKENHNKRAPGAPSIMKKFGVGLRMIDGYKQRIQERTNDPTLAVVQYIQDYCNQAVNKVQEIRGEVACPDPFNLRHYHPELEVRASLALFCMAPMRFTDFNKPLDNGTYVYGFRFEPNGDFEMKHPNTKFEQPEKIRVKDHLMNHMSQQEMQCLTMMKGRRTISGYIRRAFQESYPDHCFDWNALRSGWEMHKRTVEGYDDQSFTRDNLDARIGHTARLGRNYYCDKKIVPSKFEQPPEGVEAVAPSFDQEVQLPEFLNDGSDLF